MPGFLQKIVGLLMVCLIPLSGFPAYGQAKSFRKATSDTEELVKNKLFSKENKIEIGGPDLGLILNQSYVRSFVIHANANYYLTEAWGLSLEGLFAINNDRSERYCIENFYNDPLQNLETSCPLQGQDIHEPLKSGVNEDGTPIFKPGANFGPAYVGIREINAIVTGAAVWSPFYGKQLAFLSNTVYFDLFMTLGAGLTLSTYYPKSIYLRNGRLARPFNLEKDKLDQMQGCDEEVLGGVCPDNPDAEQLVGVNGRPDSEKQISPTLTLGIGQKFHFKERFNFKAELRNYTLLGTEAGYDTFFMAWMGFGVRL